MIGLRPMRSESAPKNRKPAGAQDQRPGDEDVGREEVHLDDVLEEEQRVELARVPDHGLPGSEAEEAISANLPFFQLPKASRSGALEAVPSSFIFLKAGDSFICRRM
jgi:hypothetical protein